MEKKIKPGWISPKILLAIGRLSNTDQVSSAKYWLASKMVIYYRSIHFYTNCMVTKILICVGTLFTGYSLMVTVDVPSYILELMVLPIVCYPANLKS